MTLSARPPRAQTRVLHSTYYLTLFVCSLVTVSRVFHFLFTSPTPRLTWLFHPENAENAKRILYRGYCNDTWNT